jgi:acyl carrier protein
VKVRGFRIELGEIESVMTVHPQVKDCVVVARDETDGEKRIVAYVVERDQSTVGSSPFRNYLRERLPEHMIPAKFVILDRLPLNGSGKIDRKALPEPDRQRSDAEGEYEGPRNEKEEKLAQIWAGLLKLERVGIHDNFFDIGGHSLLATQLVSRISDVFEVELTVRSLFNAPTIARLALEIEQSAAPTVAQTRPPIRALPRGDESLEQLLARVNQMSDGEARATLQNKNLLAKRRTGNE